MTRVAPSWPGLVVPAVAGAMGLASVLPIAVPLVGTAPEVLSASWRLWGWGALITAGVTVVIQIASRGAFAPAVRRWWTRVRSLPPRPFAALTAALFAAAALGFTLIVFEGNPRNVDGFAQLFQARIFLAGRVWLPPPPELASFATLQMILGPDRWYAQYPPGQSVVLAGGLALGAWWLLLPLWMVSLPLLMLRIGRWLGDESAARLAALLLCISPFALAVGGSEMSHLPAAVLGMAAAAAATGTAGARGRAAAVAAGAALGLMTAFRPLDAVAAALPTGLIIVLTAQRRAWALAYTAVGGVCATIPTLWYNAATTGSWHVFGYTALWGPDHSLGFHTVPFGAALTPLRAAGLTSLDLFQLNQYLLDLPFPVLVVAAVGLMAGRRQLGPRDVVPLAGFLGLVGLLFFYWHRDVFYGPRFLFTALPWLLLLVARSVAVLTRSHRVPAAARLAPALLTVGVAVGALMLTPDRLLAYRRSTPMLNLHPDRAARAAGLQNAVILVPDGWGSRLIARMWAGGISVRASTRLYARIDACTLEQALDAADADPAASERLAPTLDSLAALGRPGVRLGLTDDPALRVSAEVPLTADCAAEIAFDRQGFLVYAPFLYLNTAGLDGPVVYARDLRDRNEALRRRYPDRRYYRYGASEPGGEVRLVAVP